MSISWPPMAFISSRTIWTTFSWTRQPSGRNVQMPALTGRKNPPRTSSLWLTASASPGSSRSVGRKSWEARTGSALRRSLGRFGHHERRRLRELEALGPHHAALDPRVDLAEELRDEHVRLHLLEHAAVCVDEPRVAAAGDAEVGVARLAGAVDRAAHDGDLEGLRIVAEPLLDRVGQVPDADVVPSARGAGDHDRAALAEAERLEDLPGDPDLLHRVGGQRDADRVADSVHEEAADANGALDGPGRRG